MNRLHLYTMRIINSLHLGLFMSLDSIKIFTRKLAFYGTTLIGVLNIGVAHAEFPNDLNSGVVFTEEAAFPGTAALISSMEVTATLSANIRGGTVNLVSDRRNDWPRAVGQIGTTNLDCCNANAWAFIRVDGVWYGSTWEFIRPGSTTRSLSALVGPNHLRFPPLNRYPSFPQGVESDSIVGFMVSGVTRNGIRFNNVRERSNIVFVDTRTGQPVDQEDLGLPPVGGFPESSEAVITPIITTILGD